MFIFNRVFYGFREIITENPIHEKTEDSTESEYRYTKFRLHLLSNSSDSVTIYSSSSGYTTTEIPEKLQDRIIINK